MAITADRTHPAWLNVRREGGRKKVDRCAVLPQCSTWWNQKGSQGRGFVSGYEAGLRR